MTVHALVRDIQYAIRRLARDWRFTAGAILILGLGIGANTAIFSVIKAVVLNPLPYEAPEQIAVLWEVSPEGNQERVSVPTYEDWKRETRTLQAVAAYRQVDFSYAGTGDPRNVPGVRATPDLFAVLRAQAQLGRTFVPDEAVVEVREDLARMLAEQRLDGAPIFTVRETVLEEGGLLPEREVGPLRRWLATLAEDAVARQTVVRRTLSSLPASQRAMV